MMADCSDGELQSKQRWSTVGLAKRPVGKVRRGERRRYVEGKKKKKEESEERKLHVYSFSLLLPSFRTPFVSLLLQSQSATSLMVSVTVPASRTP